MDLLSSRPFWPIRDGLPATFPPLEKHATCDVAIIGGGISGAMTAHLLTTAGLDVVVLDRRDVAHGSTAGNTGLLLYETDQPMVRLAERLGRECAERAFLRCRAAVRAIEKLTRKSHIECGFEWKENLYLAAEKSHVGWLREECALRQETGLDVEWWPRGRIAAESSLPHAAGIFSRGSARIDAYRLTYGLLLAAQKGGARVHDRTAVTKWKFGPRGVTLETSRGARVRARHLVVAAGYEAERFLPEPVGELHSTFALATEPIADFPGWPAKQCLLWDTGDPYLYLRTTTDGRVIMGGYDEPFRDPQSRDRMLAAKTAALKRRFRQLFPKIKFEVATEWAGTFGISSDGLPFIGRHRGVPHTWFALGFGGNGTTFSLIAAEILRAGILGDRDPDAGLFGFERAEACGKA
ncbi:MAG: FAD-dependent oxidoreductase [Verrucomicrobiota bacterium]